MNKIRRHSRAAAQAAALAAALLLLLTACAAPEAEKDAAPQPSAGSAGEDPTASGEVWTMPSAGVTVPIPAAYLANTDRIYMEAADDCWPTEGISYGYVGFYPAPYEEIDRMDESGIYDLIDHAWYPLAVFGIDGGRGEAELAQWLAEDGWETPESLTQIGRSGDWTFFRAVFGDMVRNLDGYDEEIGEIARAVSDSLERSLDAGELLFAAPDISETGASGGTVSFSTADVYGNPFDSASLFAQSEITLVNVWASWCPPCKAELPELEQISRRLGEKNCAMIGILYDAGDGSGLEDGIAVMEEAGVTFPVLVPDEGVFASFPIYAFPTTFYVDRDGNLVGEPVVGAQVDRYEEILDDLLG
jgi:thiol-disulfide isomerase/thioredoxin